MEENKQYKYIEPQSMNYDRKLTSVYLDFAKGLEKKAKEKKGQSNNNLGHNQPELDDRMYEAPLALKKLKDCMAPEILKKW